MSMRIRVGPFSASTSGRVGASAGPVSFSGGGRRRRGGGSGGVGFLGFLIVLGVVFLVVMWPLSLWGHAIHLTPSWHQLMNRNKAWMHEHYPLVGLRYLGAAAALLVAVAALALVAELASSPGRKRAAEREAAERAARIQQDNERRAAREREEQRAHQRWLDGPPPPFRPPGRFTHTWLEAHVPRLHPGQIPMLLAELRARGWDDARIAQRVEPLLPTGLK